MIKKKVFANCLFLQIFLIPLFADSFLDEDYHSYQKSKENPNILVFVTSHIIPVEASFVQNKSPLIISIPQEALNPDNKAQIVSKGVYDKGNYTIFRSNNDNITFYRYTRNKTNQYSRMAPNIYEVTHYGGQLYKIEPTPPNITQCSLIISRTFEAQRTSSSQLLLNLDSVPNRGVAKIMLECPKLNDY
ncbi:hypothetical protein CQA53_08155 [Helicobacter didelphidarum]|uniref:Uncharacterized protein n=1 Tax=Helicobacter didelphidarum TaxID=2040648 RepID=A0A3D8IGJ6_9HELI|nr:hypothetical protein [Helicobacter didelphidarum]RDU64046.1 hypothetical protein CQA53_08155 [Helicobacter didelphidarum]